MHPRALIGGGGGAGVTRPDAIPTSLCRLRRLTNECMLEEEQNTRDFPLFNPKSGGGHFQCGPYPPEKWGTGASPPHPPPIYAHDVN